MVFQPGNEFWKFRTKHGANKIFSSPKLFWDECLKYFQWCEDHPLQEEKVFHASGEITRANVSKMRAMTLNGLWFFLKISKDTWYNYKKDDGLLEVIHEAEQVIYDQKFSGAAADMLNANIIARDLGLTDKKEVKETLEITGLTEEQLNKQIKALEAKLNEPDKS
jgi:hypothetical protein